MRIRAYQRVLETWTKVRLTSLREGLAAGPDHAGAETSSEVYGYRRADCLNTQLGTWISDNFRSLEGNNSPSTDA